MLTLKTPLRETGYLSISFFHLFYFIIIFFECLGIQFLVHSHVTYGTLPRQRSLTLLPRETEDFLRVGNHSRHMPPLTYLAWLQPIYCNSRSIFIHISITKIFICGGNFNKKYSFFSGPVLKKFFSRFSFWDKSATTIICQQP